MKDRRVSIELEPNMDKHFIDEYYCRHVIRSITTMTFMTRQPGTGTLANSASTARDFCMLERNILSHLKLALLLSLLSSSLLLQARLVPSTDNQNDPSSIPLATLLFVAAIACISIGLWEYFRGFRDMRMTRAFLSTPKFVYFVVLPRFTYRLSIIRPHFIVMGAVSGAIFGTCIVLLVQEG
jgi:hypothetical protein